MAYTPTFGKRNRLRFDDAIAHMDEPQFVRAVADLFREQGYMVETASFGDGEEEDAQADDAPSADLILRRGREVILLRCKHNRLYQITQKPVQTLAGAMSTAGANSAMLVASGEFTRQARAEAAEVPRMLLVDGTDLRRMLRSGRQSAQRPATPATPTDTGAFHVDPAFADPASDPFAAAGTRRWRRWGPVLAAMLIVLCVAGGMLVWYRMASQVPVQPVAPEPPPPMLPPNQGPDPDVQRELQLERARAIAQARLREQEQALQAEQTSEEQQRVQAERDRRALEAIPEL